MYWEWGDPSNPDVLLCVHGLTRNGRDFDAVARRLADRYRVVCPDMPGRGRSPNLPDPKLYEVPLYLTDCVTLVARLDVDSVSWLGTSMGGLIGMLYAALPGNPIKRLILNDVGPQLDTSGLSRIASYVGADPVFESREAAERGLRVLMADFGPLTDAQFRQLNSHFLVERDGGWRFGYDPGIAVPIRHAAGKPAVPLWPYYEAIRCPVLLIRGARSDLLSADVARRMTETGPRARLVEIDGVGHAPSLVPDEQSALIESFLSNP